MKLAENQWGVQNDFKELNWVNVRIEYCGCELCFVGHAVLYSTWSLQDLYSVKSVCRLQTTGGASFTASMEMWAYHGVHIWIM